jgi:hypothetical protein
MLPLPSAAQEGMKRRPPGKVLGAAIRHTGGDEEEAAGKRCLAPSSAAPKGMKRNPLGR